MKNFNIFVENQYENYNIDEVQVYNDVLKISEFIIKDETIIDSSCLKNCEYETLSFDIVLVNNEYIHQVNKEYRKKDSPTDVITFAIFADSPDDEKFIFDGEVNLGEIIVSLDKIEEQAHENNVTFNEELYYILSHGILHLLGFDHQCESDYNFMVEHQNKAKAVVL
jgi:probable rRNA maturation factor